MMLKDRHASGLLLAVVAAVLLSVTPTLIKVGLTTDIDPLLLLVLRLLVATVAFWILFPLLWPGLLRIDRQGLFACAAAAATNTVSLLCYYQALLCIDVSVAQMIFTPYPIIVLLWLATRGERISRLSLVRLGAALTGVTLLIAPGGHVDLVGVLLVVATAVVYSLHMALIQWYLPGYPSQTVALYVVSLMACFMGGIWFVVGRSWQPLPPVGWGVVVITGLVSTVLARLAMFAGIQRVGSGQIALLGPVETLLSVAWAVLFLGERLSPLQWAGGLLVLASAALALGHRPPLTSPGPQDTAKGA
jgi:drug/metabolite transporter (DMT)-like permease